MKSVDVMQNRRSFYEESFKESEKYFQLIMTALICFVMGVIEDKKRICIKDTDSKKDRTVLRPDDKKEQQKK